MPKSNIFDMYRTSAFQGAIKFNFKSAMDASGTHWQQNVKYRSGTAMFKDTCSKVSDCGTCGTRVAVASSTFLDCGRDSILINSSKPCSFCNKAECCRLFTGSPRVFENTAAFDIAMDELIENQARAEFRHGPFSKWNISRVTSLERAFNAEMFKHALFDVSEWDVTRVTTLYRSKSNLLFNPRQHV